MNTPAEQQTGRPLDSIVLSEMQLLLAEKRTALATLRTGIAIFAFPISVLSVLIATSKSYEIREVTHWLAPMIGINLLLTGLAVYLVIRSLRKLWHYDRIIREFKRKHSQLEKLLA